MRSGGAREFTGPSAGLLLVQPQLGLQDAVFRLMDVQARRSPLPKRLLDDPLPIPQALHVAFEGGDEFGPVRSGVADRLDLATLPDTESGVIALTLPRFWPSGPWRFEGLSGQPKLLLGQGLLEVRSL